MSKFVGLAVEAIALERKRQVEEEGWGAEHDDAHVNGDLGKAGNCYYRHAIGRAVVDENNVPHRWPWEAKWWKPKTAERDLVRAGALIEAEQARLRRLPEGQKRSSALFEIDCLRGNVLEILALLYRDRAEQLPALADARRALGHMIEKILCDVAELPDRSSPDDWPEAMLVTGEELDVILRRYLEPPLHALQPIDADSLAAQ
jgi:hypothetical protein